MIAKMKTQKFEIFLSNDCILKDYSLYFSGEVQYKEIPPNPYTWDSDWDYYGYKELQDLTITHIVKESEDFIEFINEEDLTKTEHELFSQKLNNLIGF